MDLVPEVIPPSEDNSAAGAAEVAAARTKKATIRPESPKYEPPPTKIADEAGYADVKAGTKYIDPTGQTRTKPWEVKSASDYESVPEGQTYLDPEGATRQKPTFGPIEFTAQTLYDMSVTPSEKKRSLERTYPGKVREDSQGLYVDDNGKMKRPGRGMQATGGFIASAAAPTVGAGLGALGGAAAGSTVPVAGTVAGGVAGGAGGAILGQSFNDVILQLSGVYDRSITEQAATTGMAAAGGMMGAGVGRGVAAIVPAVKGGASAATAALPSAAAHFLGARPDTLTAARELAEKGVKVPPSAWAHEAPHLQNVVEVFDPAFRTNKPLRESAVNHYEQSASKVLDDLGVKREGSIVNPEAAVPTQAAGEKILQRTLAESAQKDRILAEVLEQRKAQVMSGAPEAQAQREAVLKASEESRAAAQQLIDQGFESIQRDADAARKVSGSGANTGDLWENVGEKLQAVRRGVGERATKMYNEADALAGGHLPDSSELAPTAKEFLEQLPAEFKAKYPDIVAKLESLAGKVGEDGQIIKEATQPTFGQLHNLRSILRGNADWWTLSSDIRNGTYKYFSKQIDNILHDAGGIPELEAAAKQLDLADAFYKKNIPIFDAQQVKAVMKGLEAGEPADPANLYRVLVKEGQTDLTRRVRDMVGPNLWAGVRAADTDTMMAASKTLNPGEINGRAFSKEVLDRHQRGMLEIVHGKEASEKLLAQARAIEQLEGRLSIPAHPGDNMTQVMARARLAAEEAKAQGTKDPLTALTKDIKRLEAESKREASLERRNDPLGFLYNKSTGASFAVDKILGDEDLILAAAARFGEKSPEFNALRQVYVERVLRDSIQPGGKLAQISPEVQQLMFPGTTLKQMEVLAKEMDFLLKTRGMAGGGKMAGGMMATAKVEHPVTNLPIARSAMKFLPGVNLAARTAWTKFYSLVTDLMTSPATLRWIEKGLTKGTPEEQEAVRAILQRHLQRGSAMGAGAGEAVEQGSGE